MEKRILDVKGFLLAFATVLVFGLAGCSSPDPDDDERNEKTITVYAGGFMYDSVVGDAPCYWKDGAAVKLPAAAGGQIYAMAVSGSDVYLAGSAGSSYTTGYGKNSDPWVPLNGPNGSGDIAHVAAITLVGSDVYSAGYYYESGGATNPDIPGYWVNNGAWNPLSSVTGKDARVTSIAASGGDVYFGGYRTDANDKQFAGYWYKGSIGTTWTPLNDVATCPAQVSGIVVSDGIPYACGSRGGEKGYWDNGTWHPLTLPTGAAGVYANAITASNGVVYVAGTFYKTGSTDRFPGYWKNNVWYDLPTIVPGNTIEVNAICILNTDVYIAGVNKAAVHEQIAGYWKNGEWHGFFSDQDAVDFSHATCIVAVQNE